MQRNDDVSMDDVLPRHLVGPVTLSLFLEPVVALPCGQIYEYETIINIIEMAIQSNKMPLCPITRKEIEGYIKAFHVVDSIDDYLSKHPAARNKLYEKTKDAKLGNDLVLVSENLKLIKERKESSQTHASPQINPSPPVNESGNPAPSFSRNDSSESGSSLQFVRHLSDNESTLPADTGPYSRLFATDRVRIYDRLSEGNQEKKKLLEDIQDLIYALDLADDRPSTGNWQNIYVAPGPVNNYSMRSVLGAARRSLQQSNPVYLENAKREHANQYDTVSTLLGGKRPLSDSLYGLFARAVGTVTDQPGHLVKRIVERTEYLLERHSRVENRRINRI